MSAAHPTFGEMLPALALEAEALAPAELGAFFRLVAHQCRTGCALPDHAPTLAGLARCTLEEWAACAQRVLGRFHRIAAGWVHARAAAVCAHDARVAASRSGAAQRAAWMRHHGAESAPCMPAQSGEPVDAAALPYLPGFAPGAVDAAAPLAGVRAALRDACAEDAPRMRDACVTHASAPAPTHPPGALNLFKGIPTHPHESRARACAGVGARACAPAREAAPPPDAARLAEAEGAIRAAGVVVPCGHPVLAALVGAGVAPPYLGALAAEARTRADVHDPLGWLLGKARSILRRAQSAPPSAPALTPPLVLHPNETEAEQEARARRIGQVSWGLYARQLRLSGIEPDRAVWVELLDFHEDQAAMKAALREDAPALQ
jgi:uncharacterized protein YdaU (DUF1376 family)